MVVPVIAVAICQWCLAFSYRSCGWRAPDGSSASTDKFQRRSQMLLDAATEQQQAGALTCDKRIWGEVSGSEPESVGLIVLTRPITI